MSETHSREGVYAHMEVNRLFHKFLASAKSLLDHTLVFIEQYYKGTPILREYLQKIKAELSEDPLCRFIQDLRNYMLHKGLPNSKMSLTISKIENLLAHNILTTVSIDKEQLLLWKKWSSPGKKCLENCENQIKIFSLSNNYGEKIIAFYEWFDSGLENFHALEIAEFNKLKKELELLREQEEESRTAT